MITGKELEKIANENCKTVRIGCHKDESGYNYPDTQDVYDWQAIANELNQRTCDTCKHKEYCGMAIGWEILEPVYEPYEIPHEGDKFDFNAVECCSLYTKEG